MPERVLLAQIEAWERAPRRVDPAFPPDLKSRFEADIGPSRLAMFRGYALASFVVMAVWNLVVMPQQPQFVGLRLLHATLVGVPLLLSLAVLRRRQGKALRETLGMLCILSVPAGLAMLYVLTSYTDQTLLAIGMVASIAAGTAVLNLRVMWASALVLLVSLTYALALRAGPVLQAAQMTDHVSSLLAVAGWLLFAGWRHEYAERQAYLLGLRQRLAAQALSQQNRELADLSRRDALTGLANRRHFDERLTQLWSEAAGNGEGLCALMIDIDHFKAYNDFYGHAAGDACLAAIARCMADQLRARADCIARIGGEEFVVLLPGADAQDGADIGERLRLAISAMELPHLGRGPLGRVSISAGVAACHPAEGRLPAALLSAADAALYDAKAQGRNQIMIGAMVSSEVEQEEALFLRAGLLRSGLADGAGSENAASLGCADDTGRGDGGWGARGGQRP